MNSTNFSSNFIERIAESHRKVDDFVATNQRKADLLISDLRKVEAEEQRNIDALLRQLKSLQNERGVADCANDKTNNATDGISKKMNKLETKQMKLEDEVSMLELRSKMEQAQLDEILTEEATLRRKADEVRARKEEIEMSRDVTVEDLTRGLLNYRYTGLTFARGKRGALDFKFTKLDREVHSRAFSFSLSTDKNNDYVLSNVIPPLDHKVTDPILKELNADDKNGFNSFVVGMRKLFKETLK